MKKCLSGALSVVLGAFVANASATETLNISFHAGYHYGSDCVVSLQGGAHNRYDTPASNHCDLYIPLPIAAGHTIKQITAFHGTEGAGPSDISASLEYVDLRALSPNNAFLNNLLEYWSSSANIADAAMASGNLMAQGGIAPNFTYPDAFVTSSVRSYFVRVLVSQQSEFFGLRVLYD